LIARKISRLQMFKFNNPTEALKPKIREKYFNGNTSIVPFFGTSVAKNFLFFLCVVE